MQINFLDSRLREFKLSVDPCILGTNIGMSCSIKRHGVVWLNDEGPCILDLFVATDDLGYTVALFDAIQKVQTWEAHIAIGSELPTALTSNC